MVYVPRFTIKESTVHLEIRSKNGMKDMLGHDNQSPMIQLDTGHFLEKRIFLLSESPPPFHNWKICWVPLAKAMRIQPVCIQSDWILKRKNMLQDQASKGKKKKKKRPHP